MPLGTIAMSTVDVCRLKVCQASLYLCCLNSEKVVGSDDSVLASSDS